MVTNLNRSSITKVTPRGSRRRPGLDLGRVNTVLTAPYYLHRHIELDRDQHGPLAKSLMTTICGTDDSKWQVAEDAALEALQERVALWDGVLGTLSETP